MTKASEHETGQTTAFLTNIIVF